MRDRPVTHLHPRVVHQEEEGLGREVGVLQEDALDVRGAVLGERAGRRLREVAAHGRTGADPRVGVLGQRFEGGRGEARKLQEARPQPHLAPRRQGELDRDVGGRVAQDRLLHLEPRPLQEGEQHPGARRVKGEQVPARPVAQLGVLGDRLEHGLGRVGIVHGRPADVALGIVRQQQQRLGGRFGVRGDAVAHPDVLVRGEPPQDLGGHLRVEGHGGADLGHPVGGEHRKGLGGGVRVHGHVVAQEGVLGVPGQKGERGQARGGRLGDVLQGLG
ncbi:hypothetical protein D3C86_1136000 [compost metagenome]